LAPILTLILLVAVAIFAVENAGAVALRFATWSFQASLAYVALGAVAAGMLVATVFWTGRLLALRRRLREVEAKLRKADADLASLRNPLVAGAGGESGKGRGAQPTAPGGI